MFHSFLSSATRLAVLATLWLAGPCLGADVVPPGTDVRAAAGMALGTCHGGEAASCNPASLADASDSASYQGDAGIVDAHYFFASTDQRYRATAMDQTLPLVEVGVSRRIPGWGGFGISLVPQGIGRKLVAHDVPMNVLVDGEIIPMTLERSSLAYDLAVGAGWHFGEAGRVGCGYLRRYEKTNTSVFGSDSKNPVVEQSKAGASNQLVLAAIQEWTSPRVTFSGVFKTPARKVFTGFVADPTTGGTLTDPEYATIDAVDYQPAVVSVAVGASIGALGGRADLSREYWRAGRKVQRDGMATDAPETDFRDATHVTLGLWFDHEGYRWQLSAGRFEGNMGPGSEKAARSRVSGMVFGKLEGIPRRVLAFGLRLPVRGALATSLGVSLASGSVTVGPDYENPGKHSLQIATASVGWDYTP